MQSPTADLTRISEDRKLDILLHIHEAQKSNWHGHHVTLFTTVVWWTTVLLAAASAPNAKSKSAR